MDSGNEKIQEELREVQKEVEDAEEKTNATTSTARRLEEAEEGNVTSPVNHPISNPNPAGSSSSKVKLTNRRRAGEPEPLQQGIANLAQLFIHPILVQTFIMTFLAEWGDRSQISTIALAAAHVSATSHPCLFPMSLSLDRHFPRVCTL